MIKKKFHFMSLLAVPVMLLATACSDNVNFDEPKNEIVGTSDTVELTIMPQVQNISTRDASDASTNWTFSDGSKANQLFFEIYEITKGDNGEVTGTLVGKKLNKVDMTSESWPYRLLLSINPEKDYRVIFWAQNSDCEYYSFEDLTEITVNYQLDGENTPNNDEIRDAFYGYGDVVKAIPQNDGKVILHRPLAQINVGATGWNYEGAAKLQPEQVIYTNSTITVSGVATKFNGLTGKAIVDSENPTTTVTYDWNMIPAFAHLDKEAEDIDQYLPYEHEEFLTVKRYDDINDMDFTRRGSNKKSLGIEFFPYVGWNYFKAFRDSSKEGENDFSKYSLQYYEQDDNGGFIYHNLKAKELFSNGVRPLTEVYKYLSMCYVLVPEAENGTGSTVDVKFQFMGYGISEDNAGNIRVEDTQVLTFPKSDPLKISNVPVQRNWRTNILSDCIYLEDKVFTIDVIPEYCGDYDQAEEVGNTEWIGWEFNQDSPELGWWKPNYFTDEMLFDYYPDHEYKCSDCGFIFLPWSGAPIEEDEITEENKHYNYIPSPIIYFENIPAEDIFVEIDGKEVQTVWGFKCQGDKDGEKCNATKDRYEHISYEEYIELKQNQD